MIFTTIIIFLLILDIIVFFHEFGHFFMAKLYGVKVEEFGIGFPPRIFGIKRGETLYTINWVPLGGFVKIVGEDGEEKSNPRSFSSRSIGERFQIIAAGVIMNFFLAFLIFSIIFMVGFPQNVTGEDLSKLKNAKNISVQIASVEKNTTAQQAGLEIGDRILKADEKDIATLEDLQSYMKQNSEKEVSLQIARGSEVVTKKIIPRKDYPKNQGPLGIELAQTVDFVQMAELSYSPLESIKKGYEYTVFLTFVLVSAFVGIIFELFETGSTVADISGPIGIAAMTQKAAALGIITVMNFIAIISVNLAIINVLPFPALDGGRLVFLIAEKIKGSPLNQEWEAKVNNVGFALLMLLMVFVTFKDVLKLDLWGKITGLLG